jgi:hypothetical protein
MNDKPTTDATPLEATQEAMRALFFAPRHQAEAAADIARLWFEAAQAISIKQAELVQTATEAVFRTAAQFTRAASQLSGEAFETVHRSAHRAPH